MTTKHKPDNQKYAIYLSNNSSFDQLIKNFSLIIRIQQFLLAHSNGVILSKIFSLNNIGVISCLSTFSNIFRSDF